MKVTIINGNTRHGSTWHCTGMLKEALCKYDTVETTEYSLPKDMPHFCNGCFSCFYNGEDTCPHNASMRPITEAILDADLLILTSPVYAMDVTGGMKALLDHLCYMWMSHRPNPKVFNKIGVTITTTAGAGLKHTTKTMRDSLKYWGMMRVYSYKKAVMAMKWDDVSARNKAKIQRDTERLAGKIAKAVRNANKLSPPLFRSFFFKVMKGMMKKNTWNERDRKHWEVNGWLGA